MSITATGVRYPGISAKAYEHPADRAATAALASIPMLDTVLKKLSEWQVEKAFQQKMLADSVLLSERQLPEIFTLQQGVYEALDISRVPELYVTQLTSLNAMTVGSSKPVVVLSSGAASGLPTDSLRAVLAHEAGHVLSDHVYYYTVLYMLDQILGSGMTPMASLPLQAVRLVLLEWQRCAELSGDRAAALVVEDPMVLCRLLMRVAGGAVQGLDVNAFIAQAEDYHATDDLLARPGRWLNELGRTHPYTVRRVGELTRWVREGDFDRIRSGNYLRRGDEPPPSDQLRDATEHYRQRFNEILDRVAGGMQKMAGQISSWLRGNQDGEND